MLISVTTGAASVGAELAEGSRHWGRASGGKKATGGTAIRGMLGVTFPIAAPVSMPCISASTERRGRWGRASGGKQATGQYSRPRMLYPIAASVRLHATLYRSRFISFRPLAC